jgi:hypothetical protein
MRIPPAKSSNYKAVTVITIPESFLKKKICFYIVGKIDKGTYKVAALAESIQKDLINLLIEKVKKKLFLPMRNNGSVKMGACQI